MEFVLHPTTKQHMERFVAAPHHAVLLSGPNGIGKTTVAQLLAADILQLPHDQLAKHPYFLLISPEESGTISIEAVRSIHKFLHLKTTGTLPLRRIIIVEHADGLTVEAQNAFLKLLEEPPADTVIFLTAESVRSLLPTIQSRVLHIPIQTPDQTALFQYFIDQGKAETAMTQAFFLSGGLPGLMSALLDDEQEHPLLTHVSAAKELLQKSTFERLAMVDGLAKQKASLNNLLEALLHIALSGQQQAAVKQDAARIKQWHRIRKEVQSAQEALAGSANSKLVLTKMLLHM